MFEKVGKKEMGLLLFTFDLSSDMYIGVTFAIFSLLGKIPIDKDLLKISHNGCRTILQIIAYIALGEKLSKSAHLLFFRIEQIFKISSDVVGTWL